MFNAKIINILFLCFITKFLIIIYLFILNIEIKLKISDRNVTYRDQRRKLDNPVPLTSASPLKKAKMLTKDELREMFQQNNKQMQYFMDKIDKKLDSKIEKGFASLTSSILTGVDEHK